MNDFDPDQLRRWMKGFNRKLGLTHVADEPLEMNHILDSMRYALENSMFGVDQIQVSPKTFNGLKNLLDGYSNKK